MRKILLSGLLAGFAIACASPVESYCSKAEECGELGNETYEQCVADGNKVVDDLKNKEKESCDKIASAAEALADCQSGLSCADFKKDADATECKQLEKDLQAAIIANGSDCNK